MEGTNDLENLTRIAVHAKYLFLHGRSHASEHDPVHRMIALHNIDNAVEWLLGGLWTYYYGAESRPWTLKDMFKKLSPKQKLVLGREIEVMHEARNHVQHHAVAPSAEALARYAGYCEAFFRQTLRDVSEDLEYDELSMGVLVPDLTFRVRPLKLDAEYAELLGGKVESADKRFPPAPGSIGVTLNLRTMMTRAEKLIAQAIQAEDNQREAATAALRLLATCLTYAQWFAVQAFEQTTRHGAGWTPDGKWVEPGSVEQSLIFTFGDPQAGGSGIVALPEAPWARWDIPEEIFDGYGIDEREAEIFQDIFDYLETAVGKLMLGIDPKAWLRFQQIYDGVIVYSDRQLDDSDLLWCCDFALNTLLDLAPLLAGFVGESISVELDGKSRAYIFYEDYESLPW